jgi:hypothetical protein
VSFSETVSGSGNGYGVNHLVGVDAPANVGGMSRFGGPRAAPEAPQWRCQRWHARLQGVKRLALALGEEQAIVASELSQILRGPRIMRPRVRAPAEGGSTQLWRPAAAPWSPGPGAAIAPSMPRSPSLAELLTERLRIPPGLKRQRTIQTFEGSVHDPCCGPRGPYHRIACWTGALTNGNLPIS